MLVLVLLVLLVVLVVEVDGLGVGVGRHGRFRGHVVLRKDEGRGGHDGHY